MNSNQVNTHTGSQDTADFIINWVNPSFFFSWKDQWDRMGFLGPFADYVLSCTKGNVLEIGVGESSIYLSHVARKYQRRIYHCDIAQGKITNPLTVAGYLIEEPIDVDGKQKSFKVCGSHFFIGPSDELFEMDMGEIALAFIDGDHNYDQAKKDFLNVINIVVDNGYVILHDTYPPSEDYVDENRCGDVYKLRQDIEQDPRFDCITLTRGTAMGVGLTIVRKKPKDRPYYNE